MAIRLDLPWKKKPEAVKKENGKAVVVQSSTPKWAEVILDRVLSNVCKAVPLSRRVHFVGRSDVIAGEGGVYTLSVTLEDVARGDVFESWARIDARHLFTPEHTDRVSNCLTTELIEFLKHECSYALEARNGPEAKPKPITDEVIKEKFTPPQPKKKGPPPCVLCGETSGAYPEWGDTPCSHTKKERKGD